MAPVLDGGDDRVQLDGAGGGSRALRVLPADPDPSGRRGCRGHAGAGPGRDGQAPPRVPARRGGPAGGPARRRHGSGARLRPAVERGDQGGHRPRRRRDHPRPGRGRRRPPRTRAPRARRGLPHRLGHFRHEIGHYYWPLLVHGAARCSPPAASLFGDERAELPPRRRSATTASPAPQPVGRSRSHQPVRHDAPVRGLGRDLCPLLAHRRRHAGRRQLQHRPIGPPPAVERFALDPQPGPDPPRPTTRSFARGRGRLVGADIRPQPDQPEHGVRGPLPLRARAGPCIEQADASSTSSCTPRRSPVASGPEACPSSARRDRRGRPRRHHPRPTTARSGPVSR